jgi:hypothetical protein
MQPILHSTPYPGGGKTFFKDCFHSQKYQYKSV